MNRNLQNDVSSLEIDLSELDIQDIEVFLQEGSRGLPEFAASSGTCGSSCNNSCSADIADK